MSKQTRLSESLEDYLETILDLENQQKVARVNDIAEKLGVLRGTVSGTLKSLAEKNLIPYKPYSHITLTSKAPESQRKLEGAMRSLRTFCEMFC